MSHAVSENVFEEKKTETLLERIGREKIKKRSSKRIRHTENDIERENRKKK